MKMNGSRFVCLSLLGSVLFWGSCKEPLATFTEPQPAGIKALPAFPKRLRGEYLNLGDSSKIVIGEKVVIRHADYYLKFHVNELDSTQQLSGDTLWDLISNEKQPVSKQGDTLIVHHYYRDTLFRVDDNNVLKKYKGYYFMNNYYASGKWSVQRIDVSKGKLTIGEISSLADIATLKKLSESYEDTIAPYNFKMTKKQFKELIKDKTVFDDNVYVQIK